MLEYRTRLPSLSLRQILRSTEISFEELAKLCGVSRRQLSYWIKNGFVPAPDGDPLTTIEWAALIKHRLELGDTLRQAAQRVADYHEKYSANMRRLQEMSDEERGQQLVRELEEMHAQVNKLLQALAEPSTPLLDLHRIMKVLRNLAPNELVDSLPSSHPTPDIIIRLQQTTAHLAILLHDRAAGNNRGSHGP